MKKKIQLLQKVKNFELKTGDEDHLENELKDKKTQIENSQNTFNDLTKKT